MQSGVQGRIEGGGGGGARPQRSTFLFTNDLKNNGLILLFNYGSLIV